MKFADMRALFQLGEGPIGRQEVPGFIGHDARVIRAPPVLLLRERR